MKPNFNLLDEIVSTQGTKAKVNLLRKAVHHKDTKNFIDTIFNNDIYDIAEISINKAMEVPTKLFTDKKTFPEQIEFMSGLIGNAKIDSLSDFFSYHSQQEREWFKRALLKKFPTVGVKSYNKALEEENMQPIEYLELQLCVGILIDTDGSVLSWNGLDPNGKNIVQYKYDGNRTYIIKRNANISFISRNNKEVGTLGKLREHILNKYQGIDFIIDCEIIDRDDDFNELSTKIRRLKDMAISDFKCQVFDVIEWQDKNLTKIIQEERCLFIEKTFKNDTLIVPAETFVTNSETSIMEIYQNILDRGGEGIIIKPFDGLYEYGSRKYWWKLKPVYEGTFEIYDVVLGSGKYRGKISALRIKDKYNSIKCKVGSGLTELDVEDLTKMGKDEIIGKFVDIFFSGIGPRGLRFPRFREPNKEDKPKNIRWRYDKEEADDLIEFKAQLDIIKQKEKEKNSKVDIKEPELLDW